MNILFSTTKQWNVGDEIILKGVRNLLARKIPRHTYLPWNRSPAIRPGNTFRDNSFDELRHSFSVVDYTIFAGSPEWSGPRVEPLLAALASSDARCSFIGIGSSSLHFHQSPALLRVLRHNTDAVTCRDRSTYDLLLNFVDEARLFLLPCPSIFYARTELPRSEIRVIGLNYQACATRWHSISPSEHESVLRLFHYLSEHFEIRVICNYIDDVVAAGRFFPKESLRYSPDYCDFQEFYGEVDAFVGTRVHGCMGALSHGLPSWLINHQGDLRRQGVVEQIPVLKELRQESPAEVLQQIKALPVEEAQRAFGQFKSETLTRYQPVLDLMTIQERPVSASSELLTSEKTFHLRSQGFFRLLQELPYHLGTKLKSRASRPK